MRTSADIKISGTRTRWIPKLENISWDPRIRKFDTSVASAAFGTTSSSRLQLFLFRFLLVPPNPPSSWPRCMRYIGVLFLATEFYLFGFVLRTFPRVREVEGRKDWIEIMVYNSPARKTGERTLPSGFLFPLLLVSFSFSSPFFVFLDFYRGYGVNKNIFLVEHPGFYIHDNWFLKRIDQFIGRNVYFVVIIFLKFNYRNSLEEVSPILGPLIFFWWISTAHEIQWDSELNFRLLFFRYCARIRIR